MMIGGGGKSCARADHGIGITETNEASFVSPGGSQGEYDFGYGEYGFGYGAWSSNAKGQSYSLNLWVR